MNETRTAPHSMGRRFFSTIAWNSCGRWCAAPIEEPEALLLAQDASWWFQQKFDGRRLAVQKADGKYSGINKLGQIIPIDSRLAEALHRVQAQAFLVDGEITASYFYIW